MLELRMQTLEAHPSHLALPQAALALQADHLHHHRVAVPRGLHLARAHLDPHPSKRNNTQSV
jgi:hypothetical protein